MSELMNISNRRVVRWQLLSTASALALLASICVVREADAADDDADRPIVWIELGGDLDHATGQGEPFAPAFLSTYSNSVVLHPTTPVQAQNPPPFSFGEEGKISFQPDGSDWVSSRRPSAMAGSSNFKHVDHKTNRLLS